MAYAMLETAADQLNDARAAVGRGDWAAAYGSAQAGRYLAHDVETFCKHQNRKAASRRPIP